jgi:hypothetical protein
VTGEVAAILLLIVVHVVAIAFLVWLMLDDDRGAWRGWWPRDEGPDPPARGPSPPLPDALPARVRLRGPGRAAGSAQRRRDHHAPAPSRTREPV